MLVPELPADPASRGHKRSECEKHQYKEEHTDRPLRIWEWILVSEQNRIFFYPHLKPYELQSKFRKGRGYVGNSIGVYLRGHSAEC